MRHVRRLVVRYARRGYAGVKRVVDWFVWTPLGVAVAIVVAAIHTWFSIDRLDRVLLVVGYVAAGMLVLATLLVVTVAVVTKFRLWHTKPAEPVKQHTETDRTTDTGFSLAALRWLPLVRIRWAWRVPLAGQVQVVRQAGRLNEEVRLTTRGVYERVVRRIEIADVFGLCKVALRHAGAIAIEVLPHLGGLRTMPLTTSIAGGDERPHPMGLEDGDRVELRRYVPGDPARLINWKVFGRTRELMVRMPERALTHARRTVAYLVAGAADEASAAAARACIERRLFGDDWCFGADGTTGQTSNVDEALQKIITSGMHKYQGGTGLRAFAQRNERQGPAMLLLFVPARRGAWLPHVQSVVKARAGRVAVVVGVDAKTGAEPSPRWKRWVWQDATDSKDTPELDEALATARVVEGLGAHVTIVDRPSGRTVYRTGVAASILGRAA